MPEWGTYGSVRGVSGNGHSYRDTSVTVDLELSTPYLVSRASSVGTWHVGIPEVIHIGM